jgi:general secretion pathway protein B
MSVILDALRRSEQQRQQGLVPTIFAMHDRVGRRRNFGKWLIVIALGANATVMGLYFWPGGAPAGLLMADGLFGHEVGAPIPASRSGPAGYPSSEARDADPAGQRVKAETRPAWQPASPSPSDLQAAAAQERATGSATATTQDGIKVSHSRFEALAGAPTPADTTRPVAPEFKPLEYAGVPAATVDRSSPEHRRELRSSKVRPSGSVLEAEELSNPRGPITSSHTERNRQPGGGSLQAETPPMLWELPTSITRSLPELQFTMHVYSDDAIRRLVRVNGGMYQELDQIYSDLLLEEITEEGVVMNYKGTRFRVER